MEDVSKFLASLFLFFYGTIYSADPLFISLGSHCEVAGELAANDLRKEAYPFDWLVTSNHERFVQLLNDDFKYFLTDDFFFQNPEFPTILENSYYEIEFRHDWSFPDLKTDPLRYALQLSEMGPKYQRRIERFLNLDHYPEKFFY